MRRIADALQVPDDELEQALEEVVDLDAFLLFWALETVVNHNDGYAANPNNVDFDPDNGDRAVFLPWDADQALHDWDRRKTTGELSRRLSRVPERRQRYLEEVQWVIDEDEEIGDEELATCTGDTDPGDFMVVTIASTTCSAATSRPIPMATLLALLFLVRRRNPLGRAG